MNKKWNKKILFILLCLHPIFLADVGYFILAQDNNYKTKVKNLDSLNSYIDSNLTKDTEILKKINSLMKESERLRYDKGIALANYHQANYERKILQNHTKAIKSYEKAEAIFKQISGLEKEKILITIVKGISLEALGKYHLALVSYHKGLNFYNKKEIVSDTNLTEYQPYLYWNIANIHEKLDRYDSAEEFYFKALDDFKKFEIQESVANVLNNLGNLYLSMKNFDKAQKISLEALQIFKELKDTSGIAGIYTNLGAISYYKHDFVKSLEFFNNSLIMYNITGENKNISQSYYNIGDAYKKMDSLDKARTFFEKAISIAESIESVDYLEIMYESLSELYEKSFDYKKSLEFFKKHKQLSDSLFNLDRQKLIEETTAKYNLDQKEKEIYEMKMRTYILIGASVIILLALGVALIQSGKKRKAFKIIEQKNKDLELSELNLKEAKDILQNVNINLENLVDQKTQEIKNKNEQLEKALQDLNNTLNDLKVAHKELESIDKNKSEFLGLLSHNFATPISNIVQALSLQDIFIPDEHKDDDWYQKFQEMIIVPLNSASKKLKDRVYLMQTALGLQNKTRRIYKEPTTINNINTHLNFIITEYTERCSIIQSFVESDDLLELDESLFIEIVKILLNNAEDFSQQIYNHDKNKKYNSEIFEDFDSNEKPIIKFKTRINDDSFFIDVSDNGCGFSPQALKNFGKLMTPGDDIQNLHEGLGLGIFTAKMIMSEHLGEVMAKNNHEGGATVTLKFNKSEFLLDDL